jgi:hypothetical protein
LESGPFACYLSPMQIELLINGSSCHEAGTKTSSATTEVRGKSVDLVDECEIAGCMNSWRRAWWKRERLVTIAPMTAMKMLP